MATDRAGARHQSDDDSGRDDYGYGEDGGDGDDHGYGEGGGAWR